MTTVLPGWAGSVAEELGYPTVFVTVSGAHLYGFASVDSDLDLRAVHVLPAAEVVGLRQGPQTLQRGGTREGVELDVVSHDLAKFLRLLLRPNGYVLEQLLSPLVVRTSELHVELIAHAPGCVTRHHARHYLGFARTQWELFGRTGALKPALYTLRVLLTGIHLMRTGEVEANLTRLWPGGPAGVDLAYVPDLIAAKSVAEHGPWTGPQLPPPERFARDVELLGAELEAAATTTTLPEHPRAGDALHDLLVRARLR